MTEHSLWGTSISPDGKWIAYSISDGGSDWRIWKIMNIETRELLEETINWSKFSGAVWKKNSVFIIKNILSQQMSCSRYK